jgi:hypothetical protein
LVQEERQSQNKVPVPDFVEILVVTVLYPVEELQLKRQLAAVTVATTKVEELVVPEVDLPVAVAQAEAQEPPDKVLQVAMVRTEVHTTAAAAAALANLARI